MYLLRVSGYVATAVRLSLLLIGEGDGFALVDPYLRRCLPQASVTRSASSSTDTNTDTDAAFSAFAESLEEDGLFDEEEDGGGVSTWQENLDALLDPLTPPGEKQVFLSDLVSANEEIRQSVEDALRKRTLDPLLTPTGRRLQDGTRAVARQITTDILPSLTDNNNDSAAGLSSSSLDDLPTLVPKIGARVLDALSAQARRTVQDIRDDLADPAARIPERVSRQTAELAREARNMFRETPEGLRVGPGHVVVSRADGYEVRDYEGHRAAFTAVCGVGEPYSADDVASAGTAFNTLAAYLFGANEDEETMDMTTPVVTTSDGEMSFFVGDDADVPPAPLETGEFYERGAVTVRTVTAQRLAVARFTGFVTEGEVARQKDALLTRLKNDGVELDVPHGAVVPHKIFQYNPPYTIPIIRRNEIAVPVRVVDDLNDAVAEDVAEYGDVNGDANADQISSVNGATTTVAQGQLKKEWVEEDDDDVDLAPSDVE